MQNTHKCNNHLTVDMTSKKLSIFDTLGNIDKHNIDYYENLTEDEQKEFIPFLVMQWLACSNNPIQVILLNEFVNVYVFWLHKHPELLYYLMTVCTSGTSQRYKWKKPAAPPAKNTKAIGVIKEAYDYSTRQSREALPFLTNDDIKVLANVLGYQKEQLTDLEKELKKR